MYLGQLSELMNFIEARLRQNRKLFHAQIMLTFQHIKSAECTIVISFVSYRIQ